MRDHKHPSFTQLRQKLGRYWFTNIRISTYDLRQITPVKVSGMDCRVPKKKLFELNEVALEQILG